MRALILATAFPLTLFGAGSAYAAPCDPGVIAVTPDERTYSQPFDLFSASYNHAANCNLQVPVSGVPAGTIAVYRADYTGLVEDGASARLRVEHDGMVELIDIDGFADSSIYQHYIGSGTGASINSEITLSVTSFDSDMYNANDPLSEIGAIDYVEAARATLDDLQDSIDQFSLQRTALVTHLSGTADLLAGANRPLEQDDSIGLIGAFGSHTFGVTANYNLGGGFAVLGGGAIVQQDVAGAGAEGVLLSGALRYVDPNGGSFRPFGEIGLRGAPQLGLSFNRSYDDGSSDGVSTTTSVDGSLIGAYLRGGVLFAPDANNDIVFSGTLMKNWLSTDAYAESIEADNLFAASVGSTTSSYDTFKLGVDWTTRFTPDFDVTLTAAVGHIEARNDLLANVAFAGPFEGVGVSENFAEYGARAGWNLNDTTNLGLFAYGTSGEHSGTHTQFGADIHVKF